jgi:sirohydrochlorin ferrochelatase
VTSNDSFERVAKLLQERGTPISKVGLVIVDHGSKQELSNELLLEVVKLFQDSYPYPIVEPAHMELALPSISDAFACCKKQGAAVVIVCPFFLLPGRHWQFDIPELSAAAAKEHQVEFILTRPLGPHQMLADILQARIVEELDQRAS